MKQIFFLVFVMSFLFYGVKAQVNIYSAFSWDIIFNASNVEANIDGNIVDVNTNMRFVPYFNFGYNFHFNFNNYLGMYTGLAIRNVGLIIDDSRYSDMPDINYQKVKRRSYNLGLPAAVKFGSFRNNLYLFTGFEIELMFQYKQKYWIDGVKYKSKKWFSNATERWAPSIFAGIELPAGFNIKYKYYFNNFLNSDFESSTIDFSNLEKTKLWYISVGWQIPIKFFYKKQKEKFKMKNNYVKL